MQTKPPTATYPYPQLAVEPSAVLDLPKLHAAVVHAGCVFLPDGSVVQHDEIKAARFKRSVDALDAKDGALRIVFLPPKGKVSGHIALCHNGPSIESHGGVGPGAGPVRMAQGRSRLRADEAGGEVSAQPETLSIGTAAFGMLVGVASSAFTAGAVYAALLGRLKRSEERLDKAEADIEAVRTETRDFERKAIKMQSDIDHVCKTVEAIAEKMGGVPR